MCDQPFVLGCHQAVLSCLLSLESKVCVGSFRKYDNTLETALIHMAWCVVKCGSVYLDTGSCRYKECLDLRCIIGMIRLNVLLMSDKKDKICNRYIDLGITMIRTGAGRI